MNFLIRVLVALIFIPVLLFCFYKGDLYLLSFLCFVSGIGTWELIHMLRNKGVELSYFLIVANLCFLFALFRLEQSQVFLIFLDRKSVV